ncbi:thiol-disulfide oxidoreductase ResA [Oceanobacillus longus]|uniref:Thiol-disulfide oxidoreductase ResA n=1 Tax=Oceanobacillus longus TaxID=930120 RepID=A0ABV8GVE3_9BACI
MSLEQKKMAKQKKKRNRLIFRTAILAVLVAAVVFALVSNLQKDNTIYQVGDKAPDFQLKQISNNYDAETVQLSDLEGKGVMLNFWATWCKPCEAEMPYMQELYPEYKEKGVEIVAVSLDGTELVVDRFIDKYNLTFAIPHDKLGEIRDLYKVGPIPSTFFINPEGEIEDVVNGALTLERLEGYLQAIQPSVEEAS